MGGSILINNKKVRTFVYRCGLTKEGGIREEKNIMHWRWWGIWSNNSR